MESSLEALQEMLPRFENLTVWEDPSIHDAMTTLVEERGCKNALIMWPVRIAVSGQAVTPGGAVEICRILGREETLRRMRKGIEKLQKSLG